jgi:hypothetical protein
MNGIKRERQPSSIFNPGKMAYDECYKVITLP